MGGSTVATEVNICFSGINSGGSSEGKASQAKSEKSREFAHRIRSPRPSTVLRFRLGWFSKKEKISSPILKLFALNMASNAKRGCVRGL
jgi:hypothetical protein